MFKRRTADLGADRGINDRFLLGLAYQRLRLTINLVECDDFIIDDGCNGINHLSG